MYLSLGIFIDFQISLYDLCYFKANLKYIQKTNNNNPIQSYTNKYQEYIAFSYGYKVVCIGYRYNKPEQIY